VGLEVQTLAQVEVLVLVIMELAVQAVLEL